MEQEQTPQHLQPSSDWKKNLIQPEDWLFGDRPAHWWTGHSPSSPIRETKLQTKSSILSLPAVNLLNLSVDHLRHYFENTWMLTELLFSGLQGAEAFYRPPTHGLRHPLIFYYAHPAVFYINKLRLADLIDLPINSEFEKLFDIGVDEMSWDDMTKNDMLWPTIHEILHYRKQVYDFLQQFLKNHPLLRKPIISITAKHPLWAFIMSIEHERLHLETSSVLIRELPLSLVKKPLGWPCSQHHYRDPLTNALQKSDPKSFLSDHKHSRMRSLAKHEVRLGKSAHVPFYGWDNEYGVLDQKVDPFYASETLITNADYLLFVQEGGYHQNSFWTPTGLQWRNFRQFQYPAFWVSTEKGEPNSYRLRQCFDVTEMMQKAPVIVNYHEAKAFCAWLSEKNGISYRLMTEAEYHVLRGREEKSEIQERFINNKINLELQFGQELEVNAFPSNRNGIYDVRGNVWQWCEDWFKPFPGFVAHPFYLDFSQPTFAETHKLMLGGSFITTGASATQYYRVGFRPHFYQHAGFRLVI